MKGFNFKIQMNKPKNLYEILLNNVNDNLVISILQLDCLPVKKYQKYFDLTTIQKSNKYFLIYDSINEILDELEGRINDCFININDNNLKLKFKIPNKKFKEVSFNIDEVKDKDEIILELFYKNKELSEKKDNYIMKEKIKNLNNKIEEQNKVIENLNQIIFKKNDLIISDVFQYQILNEKKHNIDNIKIEKSEFEIKSKKKENNINSSNSLFSNNNNNSISLFSSNKNDLFGKKNNNSLFNENNSLFSNSIFSNKKEINNNSYNIFGNNKTNNNVFLFENSNSLFNEDRRNNVTNLFFSPNNTNFSSLNESNFSLNSTIHEENDDNDYKVYITNTGRKYHSKGCSYLRSSCIEKKLSQVKHCYSPCSRCCP